MNKQSIARHLGNDAVEGRVHLRELSFYEASPRFMIQMSDNICKENKFVKHL
jgi:hypothetical protein